MIFCTYTNINSCLFCFSIHFYKYSSFQIMNRKATKKVPHSIGLAISTLEFYIYY
nr:MAG TPA: hypothetical protein [Caudoviricetes sp.]